MNKGELIKALEDTLGSRKAATEALEAVLDAIVREVAKGGKVAITGFGTFEKAARAARTGRNPRTGEEVRIPEAVVPRFKAGTSFKSYVANPKALPQAAPAVARAAAGTVGTATRAAADVATIVTGGRPVAKRSTAASSPKGTAKKASAKKTTAKKSTATKSTPAKKTTATKSTAKKSTPTKSTAKKSTPAKKATAAKSTAKKTTPAKKSTAKKTTAKKSS